MGFINANCYINANILFDHNILIITIIHEICLRYLLENMKPSSQNV